MKLKSSTLLSIFVISFFCFSCSEEESINEGGEEKTNLSELRTADNEKSLSNEEKDIFYYLNYARKYPKEFSEQYVVPYKMKNNIKKPYAYDERKASLEKELESMEALALVYPDDQMYGFSVCFASQAGAAGIVGHSRAGTNCIDPMSLNITWGENISYGFNSALDIVIQLLIDAGEGNEKLGHRKNNLSPHFNRMGVSIKPFSQYGYNYIAVMNFTSK